MVVHPCNLNPQDDESQINKREKSAQGVFSPYVHFCFCFIAPVFRFNPFSGFPGPNLHLIYRFQLLETGSLVAISQTSGFLLLFLHTVFPLREYRTFQEFGKILNSLDENSSSSIQSMCLPIFLDNDSRPLQSKEESECELIRSPLPW